MERRTPDGARDRTVPEAPWFTVDRIDGDTFVLSEWRHPEETHCYLLCGRERALLIDTGLGVADLRRAVSALTDLPVLAAVTHAHWDHIGGLGSFSGAVAVHEREKDWVSGGFSLSLSAVRDALTGCACAFPPDFHPADYRLYRGGAQRLLRDGDRLELGGRSLTVIHTPGHSPGHCCFYEPERGALYTGDLIYAGQLDAFYPTTDPRQFRRSVRRVRTLAVDRLFPGHHTLDLPVSLIADVDEAFALLDRVGKLRRGSGLFDFGAFRTRL